jgi:hypothetical protein
VRLEISWVLPRRFKSCGCRKYFLFGKFTYNLRENKKKGGEKKKWGMRLKNHPPKDLIVKNVKGGFLQV